jgi:pyrimidine operon attenuation protein / uracil phosphoribosyltransferase
MAPQDVANLSSLSISPSAFALYDPDPCSHKLGLVANLSKHDAKTIHQAIERVAGAIATRHAETSRLLVLGIANGGIVFAQRLVAQLNQAGLKPGIGTLDISFHRDDIGANPIPKEHAPTLIPHDVNGATVILADDVLHSGRTVKAALDELFDHGRPASVELAVLVDRGGRLLPVAATYIGISLVAYDDEKVRVRLNAETPTHDKLSVDAAKPKVTSTKSTT